MKLYNLHAFLSLFNKKFKRLKSIWVRKTTENGTVKMLAVKSKFVPLAQAGPVEKVLRVDPCFYPVAESIFHCNARDTMVKYVCLTHVHMLFKYNSLGRQGNATTC